MFEKIKNRDIHDPAWLKRQEDVLRAHIRSHPSAPRPSGSPLISVVVILAIIGTVVFITSKKQSEPIPTPTITATPVKTLPTTPSPTASILPTISQSPTPSPSPSQTPTPIITNIIPTSTPTPTTTPGQLNLP